MEELRRNIMGEYWDLFDINRKNLGITHLRGEVIPDGMYHLVVHAWIMDYSGNFLISQRQKGRTDELLWERTGGSVLAGESSLDGALREIDEELGINICNCSHFFIKSEKREQFRDFFDAWLFLVNNSDISCKINDAEVLAWKWASFEELTHLKEEKKLVKSSEYFDEVYSFFLRVNGFEI